MIGKIKTITYFVINSPTDDGLSQVRGKPILEVVEMYHYFSETGFGTTKGSKPLL